MAARRSRRSGGRRRNWISRQEHAWTTLLDSTSLANGVIRFDSLVQPTDWVVRVGQGTCTLVRIRGHMSFYPATNTAGQASIRAAIIVADEDDATFNPVSATEYDDGDVLWTWNGYCGASVDNWRLAPETAIDVKVMRKIRRNDYIYLVYSNSTVGALGTIAVIPNVTARCLLAFK